jgi:hypothetical protein
MGSREFGLHEFLGSLLIRSLSLVIWIVRRTPVLLMVSIGIAIFTAGEFDTDHVGGCG